MVRPRPIIGRLNVYSLLALAGVIGPLVLVATDVTAAYFEPGYNLVRHSISSLALTRMGWVQTIGFLAIGLMVEVFVAGLFLSIRGGRGFGLAIGLLVCYGFGLLLIGAFRTNLDGRPPTIEGNIHEIVAKTVFCIFPVASLLIGLSIKGDPNWRRLFVPTIVTSGLSIALIVCYSWLPGKMNWFGLYERILVANTVLWVEVMAIRLLRLSLNTGVSLARPALLQDEAFSSRLVRVR